MKHALPVLLSAALIGGIAPLTPASAQEAADMAQIEMLPGWQMENGHRMAAIRVALAPGWHTYWRAPGEAGIPPSFDFAGSKNLKAIALHWPTPKLYADNGMWYLGYEDELILPIELIPEATGEIEITGSMSLGVCDDICIPMQADLQGGFPPEMRGALSREIKAALADKPRKIGKAQCEAAPISDGMRLTATLSVPDLGAHEVAVIEHPDREIWVSQAELTRRGGQIEVASDLVPTDAQPFFLNRSELTITVVGGKGVYEARGCTG